MEKNKLKTQTHYGIVLKVKEEYENLEIIQEENIPDRNAIKVKFFEERWRTPKETIEFLKKIIIVIEKNFLSDK